MSNWEEALGLNESKPTYYTVNGVEVEFYQVSVSKIRMLESLAKAVAESLAYILTSSEESTLANKEVSDGNGGYTRETTPANDRVIESYYRRQAEAMDKLIGAVLSDKTSESVAALVIDSMRDTFAESKPSPKALLDKTPAPVFMEMAMGVYEANKGLLGPLTDALMSQATTLVGGSESEAEPETNTNGSE